eukprot:TRINITY_DN57247_c0_g1_i1.p1 TRINITY_DN57247_c0_g1~~TRINITY_DN57247_c0_g1_i1.p1  ORF type:complete len:301 (+),score=41.98 TRINITY_DN57247_c0_g1_i1:172-1074(+)
MSGERSLVFPPPPRLHLRDRRVPLPHGLSWSLLSSTSILLLLLASHVSIAAADVQRIELCVSNERPELVKAWWSYETGQFDNILARTRVCFQVVSGVRYIFTDWSGYVIRDAVISAPTNVTLAATDEIRPPTALDVQLSPQQQTLHEHVDSRTKDLAQQQLIAQEAATVMQGGTCGPNGRCSGHGTCMDDDVPWMRCMCHRDAQHGHWAPPFCAGCELFWHGDSCDHYCRPNGVLEPEEACDDGNDIPNDGCTLCRLDARALGHASTPHVAMFGFVGVGVAVAVFVALRRRGRPSGHRSA